MTSEARIGIDFDNTIVAYDRVFCTAAKQCGLIGMDFVGSKQGVRDAIRLLPDGELAWQRLQGYVYGKGISGREMFPGARRLPAPMPRRRREVVIVSHKTEFGHHDPDRVNFARPRALDDGKGFFAADGYASADILFRGTRAEKLGGLPRWLHTSSTISRKYWTIRIFRGR